MVHVHRYAHIGCSCVGWMWCKYVHVVFICIEFAGCVYVPETTV